MTFLVVKCWAVLAERESLEGLGVESGFVVCEGASELACLRVSCGQQPNGQRAGLCKRKQ